MSRNREALIDIAEAIKLIYYWKICNRLACYQAPAW
jgi:hypothetical protein